MTKYKKQLIEKEFLKEFIKQDYEKKVERNLARAEKKVSKNELSKWGSIKFFGEN